MHLTNAKRNKIASYVRSYIIRTAEMHGHQNAQFRANARWMHTLNVLHNLQSILDGENAALETREICEVAVFFHDVDHYTVQHEYHAARGAETATRFLTKEGYDAVFIKRVAAAIRDHDHDLEDDLSVEAQVMELINTMSIESRMVMDADTLDKIGVSNILQAITAMELTNHRQIPEIARELTSGWPLQRARAWKDLLTTTTGRRIGEERFAFYEQFLREAEKEIVMFDPYPDVRVTQEIAPV